MKRTFFVVLFILFFFKSDNSFSGIEKIAEDMQNIRKSVVDKEVKQRKVLSGLFQINKKMKKIVTEKSSLEQQRQMLENSSNDLKEKIFFLERKVKLQKDLLLMRLSALYKFGGQGIARFLFSSESSAELERNLKILGLVAKRDVNLIKEYSSSAKELEKKKIKLVKKLTKLTKVEKNIFVAEGKLKNETTTKSKILDSLKKSKRNELSKLASLRAQTKNMKIKDDALLDLLERPAFFEQKGLLPPPIEGQIAQNFGPIKDIDSNVILGFKGVFYSAKSGTPVSSVFSGRVAYLGEVAGYGKTLIIDHGDHYYSVYSHTKEIFVREGQEISQMEKIALVGEGPIDGVVKEKDESIEGLYFEIRHFSEPDNPRKWVKGINL